MRYTRSASTRWTRRVRHHQQKVEGDPRQHHGESHPAVRGFMWDVRLEEEKSPEKSCCEANSVSNLLNSRCQVDLIDMQSQPDGCFKWICVYQDHLTKYVVVRPHITKQAAEVAETLQDIFCLFGAPNIVQSENGRRFANQIVTELVKRWPGCKIVHGKPQHSQSQEILQ